MGFKVDDKWHVEVSDLEALRRGIARLYGSAFAEDVKHEVMFAQVADRFHTVLARGNEVPFESMRIAAKKHVMQLGGSMYDYWEYNGIVVGVFPR